MDKEQKFFFAARSNNHVAMKLRKWNIIPLGTWGAPAINVLGYLQIKKDKYDADPTANGIKRSANWICVCFTIAAPRVRCEIAPRQAFSWELVCVNVYECAHVSQEDWNKIQVGLQLVSGGPANCVESCKNTNACISIHPEHSLCNALLELNARK